MGFIDVLEPKNFTMADAAQKFKTILARVDLNVLEFSHTVNVPVCACLVVLPKCVLHQVYVQFNLGCHSFSN